MVISRGVGYYVGKPLKTGVLHLSPYSTLHVPFSFSAKGNSNTSDLSSTCKGGTAPVWGRALRSLQAPGEGPRAPSGGSASLPQQGPQPPWRKVQRGLLLTNFPSLFFLYTFFLFVLSSLIPPFLTVLQGWFVVKNDPLFPYKGNSHISMIHVWFICHISYHIPGLHSSAL